jgi:RNA polymerase sigma-70 factor (ECF subfamily)
LTAEEKAIHDIINGCKKDDRKAQEQLYRSFYRVMMTLCLRYTKNENDALEVLNTGFYKVFKNISRYDSSMASLYTWIRTIIINSCLDFIKSQQTKIQYGELDQAAEMNVPPAVISKMSAMEILELVRALPPATQAVFNLFVMEGYSHAEIGKMMNISSGTSKWHLNEARKRLQRMITRHQINS